MALDLANYETSARNAIRAFWGNRRFASQEMIDSGNEDRANEAAVRGGKNLDGFLKLVGDLVVANGLPHAEICLKAGALTLPGFFRPTKRWDMLVINSGRLVVAVEFKSQVGPSFGNNFNNRTEEAIGTAVDLLTAFREGALGGDASKPFMGWLMLIEDCDKSRNPVADRSPHFDLFPEFIGASYAERYNLLCRKLVQEQLYTSTAVLLSPREAIETGEYSELSEATGLRAFVSALAGHIAAEAARTANE